MRQKTAITSTSIKILTAFILLLTLAMLISALFESVLIGPGIFLSLVVLLAYLNAPVAYELNGHQLFVVYKFKRKSFGPVVNCVSVADDKPSFSIRLWGNGGLFAGTGIFWNKKYGIFRAYVTTGKKQDLLFVETEQTKVIISPMHPDQFSDAIRKSDRG